MLARPKAESAAAADAEAEALLAPAPAIGAPPPKRTTAREVPVGLATVAGTARLLAGTAAGGPTPAEVSAAVSSAHELAVADSQPTFGRAAADFAHLLAKRRLAEKHLEVAALKEKLKRAEGEMAQAKRVVAKARAKAEAIHERQTVSKAEALQLTVSKAGMASPD